LILARIAALMLIASQIILLWVTLDLTGHTAIVFTFIGHPLAGAGFVLAVIALARRKARERADARASARAAVPAAPH
jgi:hypothetical protein